MDTLSLANEVLDIQNRVTANSKLLPIEYEQPRLINGRYQIMEPHGRGRRPKAMDHKFLAAYAAAYTYKGKVIPHSIYKEFTSDRGERLWKSQVRKACDLEWRDGESRDFDEIRPAEFTRMVDFVGLICFAPLGRMIFAWRESIDAIRIQRFGMMPRIRVPFNHRIKKGRFPGESGLCHFRCYDSLRRVPMVKTMIPTRSRPGM
jgi:hypothetical protein